MPKRSSENLNSQDICLDPNASRKLFLGFLLPPKCQTLADLSGLKKRLILLWFSSDANKYSIQKREVVASTQFLVVLSVQKYSLKT